MERLIALSPKADPEEFKGQRQLVINKLRKLGATRKPVPITALVQHTNRREMKLAKGVPFESTVKCHVRELEKMKLVKVQRVYGDQQPSAPAIAKGAKKPVQRATHRKTTAA